MADLRPVVDFLTPAWFQLLARAVADDPEMSVIGRWCTLDFAITVDDEIIVIQLDAGKIGQVQYNPDINAAWSFTLRGTREDWHTFLQPVPPPSYTDLLGMNSRVASFSIDGDRQMYVRHLRAISRIFQIAQSLMIPVEPPHADGQEEQDAPEFDPITGRYVYVTISTDRFRIYYEEAGHGPPLLCLHTAGADSRQYHDLLCDQEVLSKWRVIAFDLPYHGRSMPPPGWWKQEYLLTTANYAGIIMAFVRTLQLDRPIVLGCSMGGAIVLELARSHANELRAVIGLEGAGKIRGRFVDWSIRPDVNGAEIPAMWTYGLMAPHGPEHARRNVWWIYSQGAPGVYRGDTYFYSVDWDLRGREAEIDTSSCPVYLLTGEYDYACTPAEMETTAAAIPGAKSTTMRDIGHFPMAENYPLFRTYLLPILEELARL